MVIVKFFSSSQAQRGGVDVAIAGSLPDNGSVGCVLDELKRVLMLLHGGSYINMQRVNGTYLPPITVISMQKFDAAAFCFKETLVFRLAKEVNQSFDRWPVCEIPPPVIVAGGVPN